MRDNNWRDQGFKKRHFDGASFFCEEFVKSVAGFPAELKRQCS
ncbi:hypothetical protein QY97_03200 [Bacillus thermotolerans]|nr:hypothetical protein QY97_03200 [Bacillus thermotolerans]